MNIYLPHTQRLPQTQHKEYLIKTIKSQLQSYMFLVI